jgi:hypothetical protein
MMSLNPGIEFSVCDAGPCELQAPGRTIAIPR